MLKAHDAQLPPLGAVGHIEDGETRVEAPCIVLYYRGRYHIGVRFLDDGSIHEYRDGVFIPRRARSAPPPGFWSARFPAG